MRWSPLPCAGAVIAATTAVQALVLVNSDAPLRVVVTDTADAAVLAIAGAVLWRRAGTPTGPLLLLAGAAMGVNNLVYVEGLPGLRVLGMVLLPAFAGPLVGALLAFPGGRLDRIDRLVVAGAVLLTTVLWWGVLVFYERPPGCLGCPAGDPLPGVGDRATFEALGSAQRSLTALVGLYVSVALVRRWRGSTPVARRVRGPVMVAGAFTCLVVALSAPFGPGVVDGLPSPAAVGLAWGLGFAAIPVAMLAAVLRERTARVPLPELLRALDRASTGSALRDALAAALGDPTVEIVERREGAPDAWTRAGGAVAGTEGGRVVTPLGGPDAQTGVLHDAALLEERALLETVARAAALALELERVRRRLHEQLVEAQAIRARIVEASDDARRRIERDLHDGAQQTLVSLALALSMLDEELAADDDELALRLVRHAAAQAELALVELRDLARGVFPALLVNDGLEPALRELARRSPLHVTAVVDVPARPAPAVEAAAWFLVREALANAAAHAQAERVEVRAGARDGIIEIEVVDDGRGGARLVPGGGLVQLADRVAALGGTLEVGEAPGGGTRLAACLGADPTRPMPPAASPPTAVPSG